MEKQNFIKNVTEKSLLLQVKDFIQFVLKLRTAKLSWTFLSSTKFLFEGHEI